MLEKILEPIAQWVISVISSMGYGGIILTMAIESACMPLPSEIIMPFSGYLVTTGRFSLFWTGVAGAVGCVIGSVLAYWVGIWGGRPFLEKYGKFILISERDLEAADRFFHKYGDLSIFISRLLPVIRTFISLPAGIAKMNFTKFVIYTFVGSFFWCLGLAYVGKVMGANWELIKTYVRGADIFIVILIVAGIIYFVYRHTRRA